jgi:hypothetical protein
MTTGDTDRPGDPEQPGAVDEAIWSELVAAFHAPSAPDDRMSWPAAENIAAAAPDDDAPPVDGQFHAAPDEPGAAAEDGERPGADRDGGPPSRVVRPAARTDAPPPPSAVTWTRPAEATGPRDWPTPEDDDSDASFLPSQLPPMPELPAAAKAAWIVGIGGPVYLALATILRWDTPQWAAALCLLGGILGFGYLVSRLKDRSDDPDDDDDPTYGAVL